MIQSIIFDTLPDSAVINGETHRIEYGYRVHMAIEIEMFSDNNDEQKLLNALNLFYPDGIPDRSRKEWNDAVEYMLWFHRCGEQIDDSGNEKKSKKNAASRKMKAVSRSYCFEKDAALFYAAFLQQYKINLRKTRNADLHWWEFMALFGAIDAETLLAKVMYWRTCSLSGLPDSKKRFISKMRKRYALKDPEASMDSKTKLAMRNADMLRYVRERMEEVDDDRKKN